jgi:leucyl/phenylalanyl-tRNA--protein transferase
MFSLAPSASKLALVALCQTLEDFAFIDCQFHTPHLESMGGRYISWNEYRRLLREGVQV